MPSKTNNHTLLNLGCVQHGSHFYRNQWGDCRRLLPKKDSIHNIEIEEGAMAYSKAEGEIKLVPALTLAKDLNIIDRWIEVVCFQLSANHTITYTGPKAASLWQAFGKKIFEKKEHNKQKKGKK